MTIVESPPSVALCPHFGVCGGCSKQNLSYTEQLRLKSDVVRTALTGLSIGQFHPILPSPDEFYYRNKMEFSIGDERDIAILEHREKGEPGRLHAGLHPRKRFALVTPTPDCRLLSKDAQACLATVVEWANKYGITAFVRKSGEGDFRHLVVREGKNTRERMINLVAKSTTPHVDELAESLKLLGPLVTTFLWSKHDGKSDVASSETVHLYWGDGHIKEKLGDVFLKVTPPSFMQTNTRAAEKMIFILRNWLKNNPANETLIDLYCGSGAIGLNFSGQFERVIGIELNKQAVLDARENAVLSGLKNAEFIEGKAEEAAIKIPALQNSAKTTVIVDPPRAGLHTQMVATLLEWAVPTLLYVSCNPETLARDLRVLGSKYTILDVQPMDFFPHTDHIETAVRLGLTGQ